MESTGLLLGRLPLYDRNLRVAGYEIQWSAENGGVVRPVNVLAEMLATALIDVGLESVTGAVPAFLNVPRGWLTTGFPWSLPVDQLILCVDEECAREHVTSELLAETAARGYAINLRRLYPGREALLPTLAFADHLRIELGGRTAEEIRAQGAMFRGLGIDLIAAGIDSREEFEVAREAEFTAFSGPWFARPSLVRGKRIPAVQATALQLLALLRDPQVELRQLAEMISRDVFLSYRLMRYLNSAYFAFRQRVTSVSQAVALLGLENVRNFVAMIVLSRTAPARADVVENAFARARMCELIATDAGVGDPSAFFTTGLFSALDQVVGSPLDEVVPQLPLADEVRDAIVLRAGPMGQAVTCAIAYETCQWDEVEFAGLDTVTLRERFVGALRWTAELRLVASG